MTRVGSQRHKKKKLHLVGYFHRISEYFKISDFMKIRAAGAELFHVDRQT
jgi:hypothetical protein